MLCIKFFLSQTKTKQSQLKRTKFIAIHKAKLDKRTEKSHIDGCSYEWKQLDRLLF